MNTKFQNFSKLFFVLLLSLGLLSACESKKAPEDVLLKAKQALVDLNSGKINLEAMVQSTNDKNKIEFTGQLDSLFKKDSVTHQLMMDLKLDFKGLIKSPEKNFDLTLVAEMISKNTNNYIKIENFKTTEPNLQFFVPLIELYKGKWLHLDEGFIPENIANLQRSEGEGLKNNQLNDLFVQSELVILKEDKGIETIDGHETYHLSLTLNPTGFKDYFRQVAAINGVSISEADLEALVASLQSVNELEVYLDTEKYYIYKASMIIQNDLAGEGSDMQIKLSLEGSDFDQGIEVQVPEAAEEFNPLTLPADLGLDTSNSSTPLKILPESELSPPASQATPGTP